MPTLSLMLIVMAVFMAFLGDRIEAADVRPSVRSGEPTPNPSQRGRVQAPRTRSGINERLGEARGEGSLSEGPIFQSGSMEDSKSGEPNLVTDDLDIIEKDFNAFYRNVEKRFSNIVRKRHVFIHGDPYTIQGIPILYNSVNSGFNIGVRIALFNIRRTDPYRAAIQLQYWESDRGKMNHRVRLDFPHIFDTEWRVRFNLEIIASVRERFSGIGQMGTPDFSQSDCPDNPACVNEFFHDFRREFQTLTVEVNRSLGQTPLNLTGFIGFRNSSILRNTGSTQYVFDVDRPFGVDGGRTSHLGFGVSYDTLDFEPYPVNGHVIDLFATFHPRFLGSTFPYQRLTLSHRLYHELRPQMVFAHHWALDAAFGNPPFYELGILGGPDARDVSGGLQAMRGYKGNRFLGHYRYLQQFEVRYEFARTNWWRQRFDFSFVPHLDITRVWSKEQRFALTRFALSGGWGVRVRWNRNFVMRTDFGFSRESRLLQLGFGNTF